MIDCCAMEQKTVEEMMGRKTQNEERQKQRKKLQKALRKKTEPKVLKDQKRKNSMMETEAPSS